MVFSALERRKLPFRCFMQGESTSSELLSQFHATEEGIYAFFATRSFWEGIDIAGSKLSLVIIDKLPF